MNIFYQNDILLPLSTKYVGDDELNFRSKRKSTQDNFFYFSEPYLKNTVDHKINNYSNFVLTSNSKNSDVFILNEIPYNQQTIFSTSIKFTNNKFLRYNEDGNLSLISKPDRYSSFEITILSENTLTISYRLGYELYYLMYNNGKFYFDTNFNYVYALFYFTKNKNTYYLYKKLNQVFYAVYIDSETSLLSLISDLKNYKNYPCFMNYYIQELKPDLNTSWCSYNTLYKKSLLVNDKKIGRAHV